MRKVCLFFMVLVMASVSYGCIFPDDPAFVPSATPAPTMAPTVAPAATGISLEQVMADFGVYDEPATAGDIALSRAALDFAADALDVRDKEMFLDTLSRDFRPGFAPADFATSDTAGLAAVLRSATLSRSGENAIVYAANAKGLTFEIILVPEDGTWKIDAM